MAKRPRRRRLAPRPVPVATDEAVARLERYLRERFGCLPLPVTHASRARTLNNDGFAADVQLFDGSRSILIVRQVEGQDPEERWCMRGKYEPEGPSGFYWNPIEKIWVRATDEEAEAAIAGGYCL